MYAIFGVMNVKLGQVRAFEEATVRVAQCTVRDEPGVIQYHILADADIANRFYFFEIFRDLSAAEAHWETAHFKTWWTTTEDMLEGEPVRTSTMRPLFPSEKGLEKQAEGLLDW